MEKALEQKMYTVIRERFEDFSDHVYKVCHRRESWFSYFHDEESLEKSLRGDLDKMQQLYRRFTDALELFADCEMLSCDNYLEYYSVGNIAINEGTQAIRYFYNGRRWYKEHYGERYRFRHAI